MVRFSVRKGFENLPQNFSSFGGGRNWAEKIATLFVGTFESILMDYLTHSEIYDVVVGLLNYSVKTLSEKYTKVHIFTLLLAPFTPKSVKKSRHNKS